MRERGRECVGGGGHRDFDCGGKAKHKFKPVAEKNIPTVINSLGGFANNRE